MDLIERVAAELREVEAEQQEEPELEPEPEPDGERGWLERGGAGGSGVSGLEPFYAYGGCKRCLVLADEIDGMHWTLRSTKMFLKVLQQDGGGGDLAERLETVLQSGKGDCGKCARLEQDLARSEAKRRQLEGTNREQAARVVELEAQLQLQGAPALETG